MNQNYTNSLSSQQGHLKSIPQKLKQELQNIFYIRKINVSHLCLLYFGITLILLLNSTTIQAQPVYDNNPQSIHQAGTVTITLSSFSVPAGND